MRMGMGLCLDLHQEQKLQQKQEQKLQQKLTLDIVCVLCGYQLDPKERKEYEIWKGDGTSIFLDHICPYCEQLTFGVGPDHRAKMFQLLRMYAQGDHNDVVELLFTEFLLNCADKQLEKKKEN